MNSSNVKISIIFPSYNGKDLIYNCLDSVSNLKNLNEIEVIIVDNNSKDGTKKIIESFKKIKIKLIPKSENIGFARACNIAASKANGEFIFITNQDVSFPNNFFTILLNLYNNIKKNSEIIISTAIVFPGKYINYYGAKVHFLGFSYTKEMYQKLPKTKLTFKTLKASGCSMFLKKKVFMELNGFDPFFFMYHEDTDFSLRAIRKGISIYTTNETILHHQKIHMMLNNFTYYYIERNRYLTIYKNVKNFRFLISYFIFTEIMLIFQALLTKRLRIRFKMYRFFIKNLKQIKYLRFNEKNCRDKKFKKQYFNIHLDHIVLGRILSQVKILKIFLKLINLIL